MHRWLRTSAVVWLTLAAAVWSLSGCRRHDPPPLVARNLGTAESPLLPVAAPSYDKDILDGRATPVRVDEIPEEEFLAAAAPQDDADALPGQEVTPDDRGAIDELIELIVQAAIDGNYTELSEYFVSDQREDVVALAELVGRVAQSQAALMETLEEKAPEVVEQMKQMSSGLTLPPSLQALLSGEQEPDVQSIAALFTPSAMRMMDPETITGSIGSEGQAVPIEFKLINEEWFFSLPPAVVDPELVAGLVRVGGLVDTKVVDITGRLADDSLAPEQLMPEIMTALPEIQAAVMELQPVFERVAAQLGGGATADIPEGEPVSDEDQALLAELVDIHTEAVGERRFADLVDLVVPDQQPLAEKVYPALGRLLTALDELVEAAEAASAGSGDSARPLIASMAPRLGLDGVVMVAPGKAVALVARAGGQKPQEYEYINDNWFYRDSTLPADDAAADAMAEALDGAAGKIDGLAEAAGADVANQLSSILAELHQGAEPGTETADDTQAAADEAAEDSEIGDDDSDTEDPEASTDNRPAPPAAAPRSSRSPG